MQDTNFYGRICANYGITRSFQSFLLHLLKISKDLRDCGAGSRPKHTPAYLPNHAHF